MRRRGDRVIITSGMYEGHRGTVEANVYQRTADYPDELSNGYYIMLDTEELVTVRQTRWRLIKGCDWSFFRSGRTLAQFEDFLSGLHSYYG